MGMAACLKSGDANRLAAKPRLGYRKTFPIWVGFLPQDVGVRFLARRFPRIWVSVFSFVFSACSVVFCDAIQPTLVSRAANG